MKKQIQITESNINAANLLLISLGISIPTNNQSNTKNKHITDKEYEKSHSTYIGLIKAKAKNWSLKGAGDYDDLIQEGRLELHKAISTFDPDRGTMKSYLGFILDNRYRAIKSAALAQCRTPYVWQVDSDGDWHKKPYHVASLSQTIGNDSSDSNITLLDTIPSNTPTPMEECDKNQCNKEFLEFRLKLYNRLGDREKKVYDCLVRPTPRLLVTARNMTKDGNEVKLTIPIIAMFLGLTKNQVDYSYSKIRGAVSELVSELSDYQIELITRSEL